MSVSRRQFLGAAPVAAWSVAGTQANRYVRFQHGSTVQYGLQEGDEIHPLSGSLYGPHKVWSTKHHISKVKLLYPCEPSKILAVGLNYRSHIGDRPVPKRPEIFYKPITALQNPGDPIIIPDGAKNVHYEGELVLVIGKRLRNATLEDSRAGIFGVTAGNDVSERDWQNGPDKDLQWWRAKGCDTFAPMGPCIVRGADLEKAELQTRLNGKTVQKQYISDLVFGPAEIVSWVSKHVTLLPGDVIFTGTPGATKPMKPGDVVEIEIDGVGILRNPVQSPNGNSGL